jgi:hypothetical protein
MINAQIGFVKLLYIDLYIIIIVSATRNKLSTMMVTHVIINEIIENFVYLALQTIFYSILDSYYRQLLLVTLERKIILR